MNFLQLAQKLREKTGGSGEGPVAVAGQRGESLRYVDWIDEAWMEIQNFRADWAWMHKTNVSLLVPGIQSYNEISLGIADFGNWELNDVRLFDVSTADEKFLKYVDYDQFKYRYTVGPQTQSRPGVISRDTANNIVLGPTPDKAYTLTLDYFKKPQHLVAGTDVPAMPERFHMAIVYKAMDYYGLFENAREVVQDGSRQYNQALERIESSMLQDITLGEPLA